MIYEKYLQLCKNARISPSAAAEKAGFNRGTVSVWKKKFNEGKDVDADQDIVHKICVYFGCTEQWLRGMPMGDEPAPMYEHVINDGDLMFALWGNADDVDKHDLADVKRYAEFLRERKHRK